MRLIVLALVFGASSAAAQSIQLTSAPAATTIERFAVFTFTGGPAECRLDDAAFEPCESPRYYLDLPVGDHTVSIQVTGSAEEPAVHAWTIVSIFSQAHDNLVNVGYVPEPDPNGAAFRIKCEVSHGNYDDPIVYPGVADRAHFHMYLGNESTDYTSTDTTLFVAGTSTCDGDWFNRSSYWIPTLLYPMYDDEGQPVPTEDNHHALGIVMPTDGAFATDIYYKAGTDHLDAIQPMPRGLRMIAGNAHATGDQDLRYFRWSCDSWPITSHLDYSPHVPACAIDDQVRLTITFPLCWNGTDLDVPDHKSHMEYPLFIEGRGIDCPDSHPVTLPQVSYNFAFPVTEANAGPEGDSRAWRLASDLYPVSAEQPGGFSVHGDWFMAWHPEVMETLVEHCLRAGLDCSGGDLGNGWRLVGMRPGRLDFPPVRVEGPILTATGPHETPPTYVLGANYPNPFNPTTSIRYTLAHTGPVLLAVYDLLGREVARLTEGVQLPGTYTVFFDAVHLPSGVYLYRLETRDYSDVRQMVLLK